MIKKILLVLASLCIGLLLGEGMVRLIVHLPPLMNRNMFTVDPDTGYRMIPNFRGTTGWINFKTNSKGLRDYEHGPKKGFRIIGLGDSFTMGHLVELEDTYLSHLERLSGVEIVKAGVSGYNLLQTYEFLRKYGLTYKPDIIILGLDIGSDIGQLDQDVHWVEVYKGLLYSPGDSYSALNKIRAFLSYHSDLYYWLIEVTLKQRIYRKKATTSHVAESAFEAESQRDILSATHQAKLAEIITRFNILAESIAARFVVLLIPRLIDIREVNSRNPHSLYDDIIQVIHSVSVDIFDPRITLAKANNKRPIIISIKDQHWNREGHAVAGKFLYEELSARGYLPTP